VEDNRSVVEGGILRVEITIMTFSESSLRLESGTVFWDIYSCPVSRGISTSTNAISKCDTANPHKRWASCGNNSEKK